MSQVQYSLLGGVALGNLFSQGVVFGGGLGLIVASGQSMWQGISFSFIYFLFGCVNPQCFGYFNYVGAEVGCNILFLLKKSTKIIYTY
jgi:hypothetical protein